MKGGRTAAANTSRVSLPTHKKSLFCRNARAKNLGNKARPSVGVGAIANRPGKFREEKQQPLSNFQKDGSQKGAQEFQIRKISTEKLSNLEVQVLDSGSGILALRRFNDALDKLSHFDNWEAILEPVWSEMAFNLESFNPVFTACLLKVQCTIGSSEYQARDACLQNLIQPLAGEYGLHSNDPLGKTHRQLFSDWYTSVTSKPLSHILKNPLLKAEAGHLLFAQMMRDVSSGGNCFDHPVDQASYALGYNLAVEYLANPEKTWLLDSFQRFSRERLEGREVDWEFLEVHALGEKEHADIGHEAVSLFVPENHAHIVQKAMSDHDRDFAAYYNKLASILESQFVCTL
jgi:hypothetical protein